MLLQRPALLLQSALGLPQLLLARRKSLPPPPPFLFANRPPGLLWAFRAAMLVLGALCALDCTSKRRASDTPRSPCVERPMTLSELKPNQSSPPLEKQQIITMCEISEEAIAGLKKRVWGEVLLAGDEGFVAVRN